MDGQQATVPTTEYALLVNRSRSFLFSCLLAGWTGLTACSDRGGDWGQGDSGGAGAPAPDDTDSAEGESRPCHGDESGPGVTCIESALGRVVGEEGEPIPDLPVTVCGPVCYRGVTDEAGVFSVEIDDFILVSEYSMQAHGSPHRSTFYHSMSEKLQSGRLDVGELKVVDLPVDGDLLLSKLDLEGETSPAQSVSSGDISLSIAEGTVVRLSVADSLAGEDGRRFRARSLDELEWKQFVPGGDFLRVYALGPFEANFSPKSKEDKPEVSLVLDNVDDLSPGEEVPIYALGTYLDPDWLRPSAFEEIGAAVVSEDGAELVLPSDADGVGLRHLTWLAVGRP